MLPTEHPEFYLLFFSGHFVVKANTGVASDMKLEQTIQSSQKRFWGLIG